MDMRYDGDTLGAELAKQLQGNEKILIPRAEAGNKKLTELLEQTGAKVDDIATYTTCYEKSRLIDEKKELETGSVDCVVFTSASTVKGFVEGTKGLDYTKVKAACIGKQTKAAADAYGMQTCMAKKATIESLIELVEETDKGIHNTLRFSNIFMMFPSCHLPNTFDRCILIEILQICLFE